MTSWALWPTLFMVKGLMLLSRLNSDREPSISVSRSMIVSRSCKSVTEDMENLGSDSSRRLERGARTFNNEYVLTVLYVTLKIDLLFWTNKNEVKVYYRSIITLPEGFGASQIWRWWAALTLHRWGQPLHEARPTACRAFCSETASQWCNAAPSKITEQKYQTTKILMK